MKTHPLRHAAITVLALCAGLATALPSRAAALNLQYEQANSPNGPWRPVDPASETRQADGSFSVEPEGQRYFRLRIQSQSNAPTVIRLGTLNSNSATRLNVRLRDVNRFLRPITIEPDGGTNDPIPVIDPSLPEVVAWSDAVLASNAVPIYDPVHANGLEPAYLEVKVHAPRTLRRNGIEGSEAAPGINRGGFLLGLTDTDVSIPQFDTEGETISEQLVAQLGMVDGAGRRVLTPPAGHKIMRFGPTFHVLENPAGEAIASIGAQPVRLPHDLLTRFPNGGGGDHDGTTPIPTNRPPMTGFRPYSNYFELKQDYLSSPVFQELRRRRLARLRQELDVEGGRPPIAPESIRMTLGTTNVILASVSVDDFFLDDDDADNDQAPFLTITRLRTGGLRLVATRWGDGELVVRAGRQTYKFDVRVPFPIIRPLGEPKGNNFVPGWQEPRVWTAGDYSEQPRYYQLKRDRWCDSVGCGPTAWAILLAWWDRHGVPSAFAVGSGSALITSLRTQDAPFWLDQDNSPGGYGRVVKLYDTLHESCDVICDPFSDSGATAPGDMVDGIWAALMPGLSTGRNGVPLLFVPVPDPALGYYYRWSWDLSDPDWNEPSNVIRRANKKGRPAVVGLGWLWHYGVSYAYRYQELKAAADGPVLATRRWFRVNEGWGKDSGAWYSGGDTFLGADLKLRQRFIPPVP
jgi:hypothetical protein